MLELRHFDFCFLCFHREICELITKENSEVRKPLKVLLVLEDTRPQSDLRSWAERIVFVTEPVMKKVAGVDSTQGLKGVGVLALPTSFCNLEANEDLKTNWLPSPRRVLVLDGIQVTYSSCLHPSVCLSGSFFDVFWWYSCLLKMFGLSLTFNKTGICFFCKLFPC